MNGFYERNGIRRRRLGNNAVAEIENVAGAAGGLVEDFLRAAADIGFVGEENERVEVALNGFSLADDFPGVVETDAPVDPDDLTAGFGEKGKQRRIASGE